MCFMYVSMNFLYEGVKMYVMYGDFMCFKYFDE